MSYLQLRQSFLEALNPSFLGPLCLQQHPFFKTLKETPEFLTNQKPVFTSAVFHPEMFAHLCLNISYSRTSKADFFLKPSYRDVPD